VLGAVAVFAGIAWLARELGMDAAELRGFAVTSLWLVLAIMVLAVLGAVLLRLLRRYSRSARKRPRRGA
jgi:biotin transporter BioY